MSAWTSAHADLLSRYAARYPIPPYTPPDGSNGEACRAWTRRAAEQFAFNFPADGWGHKSAGNGRPPSTDVIATLVPFEGYDLIHNQGVPSQSLILNPGPIPLTGQVYLPVTATNHLGEDPPDPPTNLEARVAALEARVNRHLQP